MHNGKKKLKKILCSCLLIAGCLIPAGKGLAAGAGSITISYHGRTDEETVILSEAPFVLYRAGSWADGVWELSGSFQDSGVSIKSEGSSERKKQAEQLYAYAVEEQLPGTQQSTDESGIVRFDLLEKGLYLIAQKGELEKGDWIFRSAPFLVSIPGRQQDTAVWDLVIEPKSEWTDTNPGDGDSDGENPGGGDSGGGGNPGGGDSGGGGNPGGGDSGGGGNPGGGDSGGGGNPGGETLPAPGEEPENEFVIDGEIEEIGGFLSPLGDNETRESGETPKTGDSSRLELWLILLAVSAAMAVGLSWVVIQIRNEDDE